MNTAAFILGAFLTIVAGVLNGSWIISTSKNAAPLIRSIKSSDDDPISTWKFDHAWLAYSANSLWVNLVISFLLVPPATLFEVISDAPTADLLAVLSFSILWGLGTYGFGFALKIAGVGLGTTLTMSVIVVVGTLLPLLQDIDGKLLTTSGAIILFGLAICAAAFAAAAKAMQLKEAKEEDETLTEKSRRSTTFKVFVCVTAGVLASMLQFAFVFSEAMRLSLQNDYDLSSDRSSGLTFFFAITACTIVNIILPGIKLRRSQTLHLLFTNKQTSRHSWTKTLFIMAVPWVTQAQLYGLCANSLLGEQYGAAIGWPLLIVTTNATGLILGWKLLAEWVDAPPAAIKWLVISLIISGVGLIIIAVGGFA